MNRFHNINGEQVPFTAEEEAARDAEEQTWAAGATDRAWNDVRAQRNRLLENSDFTQLDDNPKDKIAWKTYRQALRDITNAATPDDVVWPTEPA